MILDTDIIRHSLIDGDRHMIRLRHIPTNHMIEFEGKLPKDRKKEATVRAENRRKALEHLEKVIQYHERKNASISI